MRTGKNKNLEARLRALEARRYAQRGRTHHIIVDRMTTTEARQRYEQTEGFQIAPDDLVIFRLIVDPGQARP